MEGYRPVKGLIQACGDHDSGKTTFGLEAFKRPDRVAFIDHDVKGAQTVARLKADGVEFGVYVNLVKELNGKTELAAFDTICKLIDSLPANLEGIVWDTWSNIGNYIYAHVVRNPTLYRSEWSPNGEIKGGQRWQSVRLREKELLAQLASKAAGVVICSHMAPARIGKIELPNKKMPRDSKVLEEVCTARFWLRRTASGIGVPSALVLKRIDKKVLIPGHGLRTVQVLPQKITPQPGDYSLWDVIERYWQEPVGERALRPDEVPDEYEISLIEGTLTADQKEMYKLILQSGAGGSETLEVAEALDDMAMKVQIEAAKRDGATLPMQIVKATSIGIADVLRLMNTAE